MDLSPRKTFMLSLVATFLVFPLTHTSAQIPTMNAKTEEATKSLKADVSAQFSFDEGRSSLTSSATEKINDAINKARKEGKIEQIQVITWSDREYPAGKKHSKADINLADERAKNIKSYLTNELKAGSVKTYNMAERPNALEKMFQTPDAKIKKTMEATGSAPTNEKDTGLFGLDGKASQAILLIHLNK